MSLIKSDIELNGDHSSPVRADRAIYVAEHGCKWRGLPKRFGNWHTASTRMSRWAKSGVLDRAFEQLQRAQVVQINIEAVTMDSTSVKVHPDGTGAPKNRSAGYRQIPWWMEHQDPPRARPVRPRTTRRNPEMYQAMKGSQWHFGMKAHIGVDAKSGLVRFFSLTTERPYAAARSSTSNNSPSASNQFVTAHNMNCKPFKWTASACSPSSCAPPPQAACTVMSCPCAHLTLVGVALHI